MKSTLCSILLLVSLSTFAQNGLLFDGVDDYVQCPMPGPTGNSSRTVEAWVKINTLITTQTVIVDWGDMLTGGRFTLNIINGKPRIEVGGNGFISTTALSTGTWHHLAATFDNLASNKLNLYVDGVFAIGGNPSVTTFTSSTNGIIIGKRNDNINYFSGYIDEVKIWNIARTQAQIAADMNSTFCLPYAGIVASFNFNQGSASGLNTSVTTLLNQADANNNGTLHNFGLSGSTSNWTLGQTLGTLTASTTQAGGTLLAVPSGASTYQWINCSAGNSVIAGANAISYTPVSSGSYAVIVSKNGCVDTSACVNMTVGIYDETVTKGFIFYPNPFADELNLNAPFDYLNKKAEIKIYDFQGKQVYSCITSLTENNKLKISELPSGVYFLEILGESLYVHQKLIRN